MDWCGPGGPIPAEDKMYSSRVSVLNGVPSVFSPFKLMAKLRFASTFKNAIVTEPGFVPLLPTVPAPAIIMSHRNLRTSA